MLHIIIADKLLEKNELSDFLMLQGIEKYNINYNTYLYPERRLTRKELIELSQHITTIADQTGNNIVVVTDNDILFYSLRVCVRHGYIECTDVSLWIIEGEKVYQPTIDKHGKLDFWVDLLGVYGRLLDDLL